jgi:hypothetical protein
MRIIGVEWIYLNNQTIVRPKLVLSENWETNEHTDVLSYFLFGDLGEEVVEEMKIAYEDVNHSPTEYGSNASLTIIGHEKTSIFPFYMDNIQATTFLTLDLLIVCEIYLPIKVKAREIDVKYLKFV